MELSFNKEDHTYYPNTLGKVKMRIRKKDPERVLPSTDFDVVKDIIWIDSHLLSQISIDLLTFKKRHRWSYHRLAEFLGLSYSSIYNYAQGLIIPPISTFILMYERLGLDWVTLLHEAKSSRVG